MENKLTEVQEVKVVRQTIQKELAHFVNAGISQPDLENKLVSFAYQVKKVLEASKKRIADINPQSVREAFRDSVDTGMPVDTRGLAYVIPYGAQIQYSISYKGLIARIQEINPTAQVKAEIVYRGDTFQVEKTDGQAKYTHKLANPFATLKDMIGVYAYIEYTLDGKRYSFIELMSKDEITKIKGVSKTAKVWDMWFSEMAKKAAIRRLCKSLFVGNPKWEKIEEVDNKSFDMEPKKATVIDYSQTIDMPEEKIENAGDTKKEEPKTEEQVNTEVVESNENQQAEEDIPFGDEEAKEEDEGDIKIISSVRSKEGTTKGGKPYILFTLLFEDGTAVRTFDKKEYSEGQKVKLVDVVNDTASKVEIIE